MNKNYINCIINGNRAIFLITQTDGSIVRKTIEKESEAYPVVFDYLNSEEVGNPDDFLKCFDYKSPEIEYSGIRFEEDGVYYGNNILPRALANKIKSMKENRIPIDYFEKFVEKILKNPSASSINELYDFLAYKELPITSDGHFLAYKGISVDGYSVTGNKNTKVKCGIVNEDGRIKNNDFGKPIEVERNQVDDDRDRGCSFGLHVGSLKYAKAFAPVLILVKVDPADVVSVPKDCDFQKCRVSKYIPLQYVDCEISDPVLDDENKPVCGILDPYAESREARADLLRDTLEKLYDTNDFYEDEDDFLCRIPFSSIIEITDLSPLEIKDAATYIGVSWICENDKEFVLW